MLTGLGLGDSTLGLPRTTDSAITAQFEVVKGLYQQAKLFGKHEQLAK
ncbi:MAG: hypothetical protein GJ671_08125 [Alteromonadaceae bacterium]|nr:hypothetical protein [Alteromonadaceae bacterium]